MYNINIFEINIYIGVDFIKKVRLEDAAEMKGDYKWLYQMLFTVSLKWIK